MINASFKLGAKGFCVESLQARLGIKSDGDYGPKTAGAVQVLQRKANLPVNGEADARVHNRLMLEWPSQFFRCLTLTGALEGTGFGGVNRTDIDGAGITMGIIGFTSKHNEVQPIIREYLERNPNAMNAFSPSRAETIRKLMRNSDAGLWAEAFYGTDGKIDFDIVDFLNESGKDPLMREIQIRHARQSFWKPACMKAQELGLTTMAGYGLMFDIAVQNGGFKEKHMKEFNKITKDGTQSSLLRAVATAVANTSNPEWRKDVYKRKMIFADGAGIVHGDYFDLDCYAFERD